MGFRLIVVVAALFVRGSFAQTSEEALESAIVALRYPPLANQARIQGDVHVTVGAGKVIVVSGHPLLAEIAIDNAKSVAWILGKADLEVTYHFMILDTGAPISTLVSRGSAFDRAFLRMFGRKTLKVVVDYECDIGVAPSNDFRVADRSVEVWVFGRTRCLETSVSGSV